MAVRLMSVLPVLLCLMGPFIPSGGTSTIPTEEEQQFIDRVNSERVSRGENELALDESLTRAARDHSREMCELGYFDHISPTPGLRTPLERFIDAVLTKPAHAEVGENLFYCSIVDVDLGHKALMGSLEHRNNILYRPFKRIGVGVYMNENGEIWVTEMFLDPNPEK